VFFMACTGFGTDKKKNGASSFSSLGAVLKSNVAPIVFALLNGLIIAGAGLLIPKAENSVLQDYLFLAVLLVQLSMFVYTSLKGCAKIKLKDVLRAILFAVALLVFTVLVGMIPGVSAVFGIVSSLSAWLRASVAFVLCTLLGFVYLKDSFFA